MQTLQTIAEDKKPVETKASLSPNFSAYSNITEQYASEAAFLWLLRSRALASTQYYTTDMIDIENRMEGNLQGLLSVGDIGWHACVEQLQFEEAGEVFVASVIALRSRDAVRIKMVCELALSSPEMLKGLISALGWIELDIAKFWMQRFLTVTDPAYKTLGLAICSVRRIFPDKYLLAILQDPATSGQASLHARALRLIGELKRWELIPALNAAMDADEPTVCFWANWSAALLGNPAAIKNLKPWVLENTELSEPAIKLVFSALSVNDARVWIAEMVKNPEMNRATIKAIAVLGDPQAIPWLIQLMANKDLARLSGWAFSQITGVDLEKTNLITEQTDEIETGPNDDPDDENISMDEDEDYTWPDKNKVTRLWQVHSRILQPGHRYFQGQEITKQLLDSIYVNANQQQKELAAIQRAIFDKHTALVNTKARSL